jgi:hypothetical protein
MVLWHNLQGLSQRTALTEHQHSLKRKFNCQVTNTVLVIKLLLGINMINVTTRILAFLSEFFFDIYLQK